MPPSSRPDRRSAGFLLVCALAHVGGVIGYLPLLTLLLPVKVEAMAGDARLDVLTACVVAGTLTASVANILFGWLSDRSVARDRGRRGWLALGLAITAAGYLALAVAPSVPAVVGAIMLFQLGINAVLAPLFAIIADEVPDGQKGTAGGLLALANPAASAFSSALVASAALGPAERLLLVPLAVAICVLPLLATRALAAMPADPPIPTQAKQRDFAIVWAARLLVQVAGNALFLYQLYYFESIVPAMPRGELAARVGQLLAIGYLIPLPVAVLVGHMSDRTGQRRPFLFGAAVIATAGLVGMALANSWWTGALAFAAYLVGEMVFLALHAGFAMQLLPRPAHRGRDLGILNLSNTLPALAGPLLTWLLASPHDFRGLMLSLATITLTGGLVILAARGRDQRFQ